MLDNIQSFLSRRLKRIGSRAAVPLPADAENLMRKATLKQTHFMRTTKLLNSHKVDRNSVALGKRTLYEECVGLGQVAHMCLAVLLNWKVPWTITYTLERPGKKMLRTEQTLCICSCVGMSGNSQGVRHKFYHAFFTIVSAWWENLNRLQEDTFDKQRTPLR